ncbi:MAG: neutral/alkaline non-lysosomal ceramidase N-terminal domain-containing protein [Clostridia bacterium]|nr:neutral/alkaline non-lysosomal ceramidase N-terminal domain-containing protein [Clostridia bacterium]
MKKQLLCGAAERIVTPALGVDMPGYFGTRTATGVKDDLYAQAIILDNGEKLLAVLSIDILDFLSSFANAVRRRLSERIGIDPKAVLIVATHIHTGHATNYTGFAVKKNTRVMKRLEDLCVEAAVEAYENRVPVTLKRGSGEQRGISFNRNFFMADGKAATNPGVGTDPATLRPMAEIDYRVEVLRFDDEKGTTVGQIVNFACHPDVVGGTEFSADYPGEMRRILKENFGKDSVVAFLNGCAGNINHIDAYKRVEGYKYPRDHYKYMGQTLAKEVLRIHEEELKAVENYDLSVKDQTFRAKRRQPTEEDLAFCERVLAQTEPDRHDIVYAQEMKAIHDHPKFYESVEVQTLRIGESVIVGLPGEIYSDIGMRIKDVCGFDQCMVTELANGTVGYVVSEPAFSAGVYETKLSRYNSALSPDAGDRMVEVAGKLMKNL